MLRCCAWCHQEGKLEVLEITGEGADAQQSHGICRHHALRLRHEYRRSLFRVTIPTSQHSPIAALSQS